jgi:hypothetical protein
MTPRDVVLKAYGAEALEIAEICLGREEMATLAREAFAKGEQQVRRLAEQAVQQALSFAHQELAGDLSHSGPIAPDRRERFLEIASQRFREILTRPTHSV